MAISNLLDCLCGSRKKSSSRAQTPVTRIQYEIEGKNLPESSGSQESIDSSSQFTKRKENNVEIREESRQETAPKLNRALVVASKGTYTLVDHPFPELAHDKEVIISNRATGLNPIDYKSVDYNFCLPEFPWVTGREMTGVVEAVGAGVTGFKIGDHVWTSTYYRDRRAGCFQSYVTVPVHTIFHLPSNLNFNAAACLGVAGLTAAMTLWRWLDVPLPTQTPSSTTTTDEYLLIWGGSTSTGQFAIQLALLSNLRVIAVTSSKTSSMVQSLGATTVIRDGKTNDEILSEILSITGDNITRAIDLGVSSPHWL
ncbi:hypothetical protein G7Y89_g10908 [Cudoniella acicularis]|uniref:Enoyl reductase (ER) domain-containing protein n=1 Tax=Cudoniella acicularis TaxID=354080 RepID=A0A8H4RE54_9HELO|nr:hypothetical protein G7Y89_g10908 [Cudoniella acicularis]